MYIYYTIAVLFFCKFSRPTGATAIDAVAATAGRKHKYTFVIDREKRKWCSLFICMYVHRMAIIRLMRSKCSRQAS